jgi:hypothetical protein
MWLSEWWRAARVSRPARLAPATKLTLDGYCIGKLSVIEAEYKAFVAATHPTSYSIHSKRFASRNVRTAPRYVPT